MPPINSVSGINNVTISSDQQHFEHQTEPAEVTLGGKLRKVTVVKPTAALSVSIEHAVERLTQDATPKTVEERSVNSKT